jgi:hypothetical protein
VSTGRYCAREVVGHPADVFSLGCIFYEIWASILCVTRVDISPHAVYAAYLDDIHLALKELRNHSGVAEGLRLPREQISRFSLLIIEMIEEELQDRPSASEVALRLGANDCCYLEREPFGVDS